MPSGGVGRSLRLAAASVAGVTIDVGGTKTDEVSYKCQDFLVPISSRLLRPSPLPADASSRFTSPEKFLRFHIKV